MTDPFRTRRARRAQRRTALQQSSLAASAWAEENGYELEEASEVLFLLSGGTALDGEPRPDLAAQAGLARVRQRLTLLRALMALAAAAATISAEYFKAGAPKDHPLQAWPTLSIVTFFGTFAALYFGYGVNRDIDLEKDWRKCVEALSARPASVKQDDALESSEAAPPTEASVASELSLRVSPEQDHASESTEASSPTEASVASDLEIDEKQE